jgi:site-specific DNA-methyltransferase (adenine-specific)
VQVETLKNGVVICGSFPSDEVIEVIKSTAGKLPLVITDPPYGGIVDEKWDKIDNDIDFCAWMIGWTNVCAELSLPGAGLYVWGGTGKPRIRPFYRYLVEVEQQTQYQLANHITWNKKRAYGLAWNYLYTREELAYLVLGDVKKPRCFNIPLLDTKRGYTGFNAKYAAKSEFYRRTNVWSDITDMGKKATTHPTEKPVKLGEIPILTHTLLGEWVLDPFAGSGSTGAAAINTGRKFVLVEQDEGYFEQIVRRLKTIESL